MRKVLARERKTGQKGKGIRNEERIRYKEIRASRRTGEGVGKRVEGIEGLLVSREKNGESESIAS